MKTVIAVTNPDAVPVSLTITMPLSDWKKLREQLSDSHHPSWKLARVIREAVDKITEQVSIPEPVDQ